MDLCLYLASVEVDGEEFQLCDNKGALIKANSLIEIQKLCRNIPANERVLRHESPYDEMIGGPDKPDSNRLEVPIGDNKLY